MLAHPISTGRNRLGILVTILFAIEALLITLALVGRWQNVNTSLFFGTGWYVDSQAALLIGLAATGLTALVVAFKRIACSQERKNAALVLASIVASLTVTGITVAALEPPLPLCEGYEASPINHFGCRPPTLAER